MFARRRLFGLPLTVRQTTAISKRFPKASTASAIVSIFVARMQFTCAPHPSLARH
jgi:hypothetical protein